MNSIKNIQERFSLEGIPVAGLGYFRDYKNSRQVAVPDSEGEWQGVSLNEDYIGYIRAADRITYTQDGFIGCDTRMYDVQQDCVLVLWHSRDQNQRQVIDLAFRALGDVLLQNMSTDRERILADEVLPENDFGLVRIAFRIEYKYVGNSCPIDLCTGYFEPCFDRPSCSEPLPVNLCEQVSECLSEFISDDEGNGLRIGEDGKLFVGESGGGGLTCEDLEDCEVIQILQQGVQAAQGTAESALSTANAAYPATNPAGFQTSAQVTASILPLLPLVSYLGAAGHTGDQLETIVLTFTIQPNQWLTKGMYQVIADCNRIAQTPTYRIYLNTIPVIAGGILIFQASGAVSVNAYRHFMVDGTSISHTDGVGVTATDINSGTNATRVLSTLDRSVTIYAVCTIQGNTNAANGSFNNIQIGLV